MKEQRALLVTDSSLVVVQIGITYSTGYLSSLQFAVYS